MASSFGFLSSQENSFEETSKHVSVRNVKMTLEVSLKVLNHSDKRILLVVFALFVVSSLLDPGPLRSKLEVYLVLSLVPGLLTAISIMELLGSGIDTGSWVFYVRLFWIFSTGYLSAVFVLWIKGLLSSMLSARAQA